MITVKNSKITISQGDTVPLFFRLSNYKLTDADRFTFYIASVDDDGVKVATVLEQPMQAFVDEESGDSYLYMSVPSSKTKDLAVGSYVYDIRYTNADTEFTMQYEQSFVVKEVAHGWT